MAEQIHECRRRRSLALLRTAQERREPVEPRHLEARCGRRARGQIAAECLPVCVQVLHLRRVGGRLVEPQLLHVVVRKRQRKAVAERAQRLVVQLLLLVGAHLALPPVSHAVALLGLGQDHRRLPAVPHGGVVRSVDLHGIVSAAAQPVDVLVGHVRSERLQLRILVEEVLAVEAPVGRRVGLELAVDSLVQPLQQHRLLIAREERIPVRTPQHLDHVPTRAGEEAFQLLHDRAVAAHRAVEPLQVAVDDEDEIVEPLARGERQARERLGLVHLAVADKAPNLATIGPRTRRDPAGSA